MKPNIQNIKEAIGKLREAQSQIYDCNFRDAENINHKALAGLDIDEAIGNLENILRKIK